MARIFLSNTAQMTSMLAWQNLNLLLEALQEEMSIIALAGKQRSMNASPCNKSASSRRTTSDILLSFLVIKNNCLPKIRPPHHLW